MHPPQTHFARALARLTMRNPERLWLHYGFALMTFFGLILTTYWLNGVVIERGLMASEGVRQSSQQVLLAQQVLQQASTVQTSQDAQESGLNTAIAQMEKTHRSLATQHSRSDALRAHYFQTDKQLYQRVNAFIGLARQVADGGADTRDDAIWRLQNLYMANNLDADLRLAATLFARQVEEEAAYFTSLKNILLWASALVLIVEALFVFWPAQNAVQATINKMRRQTSVLRASQTRLKEMNGRLERIVLHDQLTGLPNRKSLVSFLDNAISHRRADEWQLYLVGLDGFKAINDLIGHENGDALLVAISRALQQCVDYDDIVAHVGGDAFVLISEEQKEPVLRRLMKALDEPFAIKGRRISVNASIGFLTIGTLVRKPLDIVADAEIALQSAKDAGGNRAVEFTQNLRDDLGQMQKLQMDLRDAIESGEIEPWFQPQVRFADGKLHGAEVLARWRHPTRGLLTPDKFLPAAETAGLMIELDHAIWRSAMRQAKIWQAANLWRPVISLNAAPDTISDPHLIERFLVGLQHYGLSEDQVIIEVLETTLINGKDDMAAINIDSLAECGISLELDDFGTGYASLSKLTQLPLTGIKLDRSLISPLPDQAADSVVRAILALAAELGLHVVAEGVEDAAQAAHLLDRGCGIGQGYGFGRPMPADEFTVWLKDNAAMVPDFLQPPLRA